MADPKIPYALAIQLGGATSPQTNWDIVCYNRANGENAKFKLTSKDDGGQAIVDLGDVLSSGITVGNVIELSMTGSFEGSAVHTTVASRVATVTLTVTAVSTNLQSVKV